MKLIARYVLLACLFLSASFATAQDTTKRKAPVQKPVINSQGTNQAAPVKQYPARTSLWAQLQATRDSLKTEIQKTAAAQARINEQSKIIANLQDSLKSKAETPKESEPDRDNDVTVLGSTFTFSSYNAIVLGALLFFALAFAFVVFRSSGYRKEAQYRVNLYQELFDEFQAHKIKANDKEKKLARELQDERNKIEEMKGR